MNTRCHVCRVEQRCSASVTLLWCGHSGVNAAFCTLLNGSDGIHIPYSAYFRPSRPAPSGAGPPPQARLPCGPPSVRSRHRQDTGDAAAAQEEGTAASLPKRAKSKDARRPGTRQMAERRTGVAPIRAARSAGPARAGRQWLRNLRSWRHGRRGALAATERVPLILRKRKDRNHNVPAVPKGPPVPRRIRRRSHADTPGFGQPTSQATESAVTAAKAAA